MNINTVWVANGNFRVTYRDLYSKEIGYEYGNLPDALGLMMEYLLINKLI